MRIKIPRSVWEVLKNCWPKVYKIKYIYINCQLYGNFSDSLETKNEITQRYLWSCTRISAPLHNNRYFVHIISTRCWALPKHLWCGERTKNILFSLDVSYFHNMLSVDLCLKKKWKWHLLKAAHDSHFSINNCFVSQLHTSPNYSKKYKANVHFAGWNWSM